MLIHGSILTGCNKFAAQCIASFKERSPFNMFIAKHTGVGCTACEVFFYEIINNKISELITDVKNIMRESMLYCSHAGIVEAVEVTATRFFFRSAARRIVPGFHG